MGKLAQLEKKTNHGRKLRFGLTTGLYFTFPSLSFLLETWDFLPSKLHAKRDLPWRYSKLLFFWVSENIWRVLQMIQGKVQQ